MDELKNKKREKDRQHSLRHYEYLKHKIEDEEGSAKKQGEIRKMQEEYVVRNLSAFDQKVSRGVSNAEHHKRETASRASRMS